MGEIGQVTYGLGLEWIQMESKRVKMVPNGTKEGLKGVKWLKMVLEGIKLGLKGSKGSIRWSLSVTIFVTFTVLLEKHEQYLHRICITALKIRFWNVWGRFSVWFLFNVSKSWFFIMSSRLIRQHNYDQMPIICLRNFTFPRNIDNWIQFGKICT